MEAIKNAGLSLNHNKCMFNQCSVSFLGHLIDLLKSYSYIAKMSQPTTVTQLRRFLGMINQMSKFSPIHLKSHSHSRSYSVPKYPGFGNMLNKLKRLLGLRLLTPRVLSHYSIDADTKVSADVSSHRLGVVLLQLHNEEWKPIAFVSCSLSDTDTHR